MGLIREEKKLEEKDSKIKMHNELDVPFMIGGSEATRQSKKTK